MTTTKRPPIFINNIPEGDKKKLKATSKLSKVFATELPEDTIHIIVQRPVQAPLAVPAPARARSSTPFSDASRPGTPLSDDLRIYIKTDCGQILCTRKNRHFSRRIREGREAS
ncbi:hypothetical protein EMPS_11638 [Entomortierella parvispora]|uniref:Uncharacterized protein n=1 Tax=Entomortierella parvispora TaxID=205924 RepID=A0A9P3HPH2_9FUNG|nr:hypothetical protein EMPS_11638 [Entomortierella parvispora]